MPRYPATIFLNASGCCSFVARINSSCHACLGIATTARTHLKQKPMISAFYNCKKLNARLFII